MTNNYPTCFASQSQYASWRQSALKSLPEASSYCADCTLEFQQKMITQSRCAHPKTVFEMDCTGFIDGRRPIDERLPTKGRR
jgi:hypothetical protein